MNSSILELFFTAAASARTQLKERRFERHDRLITQGKPVGGIFVLTGGLAAVRLSLENGQETLIALSGTGETQGDLEYFLDGAPAICSVEAVEDTIALWADAAAVDAMIRADPALAIALAGILASRLFRSSERMSAAMVYPLEYNLLKALSLRMNASTTGVACLSKHDLADYLGHTERHLNRLLKSLAEKGIAATERGMVRLVDARKAHARMAELAHD